ncbi:MAG TPA: tetratricopeptide repeat protein [Candidatus Obscuribacterales bacterium]
MVRWKVKRASIFSLSLALLLPLATAPALAKKITSAAPPTAKPSATDNASSTAAAAADAPRDAAPEVIQTFEKRLFFRNYVGDQLSARVERIEKHVFGEASTGALQDRISKLENVLKQQLSDEQRQQELMGIKPTSAAGEINTNASGTTGGAAGGTQSHPSGQLSTFADPTERARIAAQAAKEQEIANLLTEGVDLYRKKHGIEAQAKFSQVLRLDPHNAQAHFNLGIVRESLGNYVEALGNYRQAAQEEPDNRDYTEAVAQITPKAEKQRALAGQHDELKELTANANAAWKRGEYMSALDLYLQLDNREPNKALVKYNIGSIYMMLKDHHNALTFYQEAHKLEPRDPKYAKAYEELAVVVKQHNSEIDRMQQTAQSDFKDAQQWNRANPASLRPQTQQTQAPMRTPGNGAMQQRPLPQQQAMQRPMQQTQSVMQPNQMGMQQQPMMQMQQQQQRPMAMQQQPLMQMQQQRPMAMQQQPVMMQQQPVMMQQQPVMMQQQPMTMQQQPMTMQQQPVMQMQQQPMAMQQQPMMPMQQQPMAMQQQPAQQQPVAPVAQQETGGYDQLNNAAANSPFAPVMTTNAPKQKGRKGRTKFGMSQQQASQFTNTTPRPIASGTGMNMMNTFGIAGKSNGDGVTVTNIGIASRAASAGLQSGDDIRAVDGNQVSSPAEINDVLSKSNTSSKVKFLILRNGNLAVLEL